MKFGNPCLTQINTLQLNLNNSKAATIKPKIQALRTQSNLPNLLLTVSPNNLLSQPNKTL